MGVNRWNQESYARAALRANQRQVPGKRRPYRLGTLIWLEDGKGSVRTDDGPILDVIIPKGMWVFVGNRVALYAYPEGWVIVAGVVNFVRDLPNRPPMDMI